jgi:hypothetical protein
MVFSLGASVSALWPQQCPSSDRSSSPRYCWRGACTGPGLPGTRPGSSTGQLCKRGHREHHGVAGHVTFKAQRFKSRTFGHMFTQILCFLLACIKHMFTLEAKIICAVIKLTIKIIIIAVLCYSSDKIQYRI